MTVTPKFAQTEAYWLALRAEGQLLPSRRAFDPRGVGDAVENLMLLERIAPGQVRIRIAGQQVGALFGIAPQGMPLTALLQSESRGAVAAHMEEMFCRPAIGLLTLKSAAGYLRPADKAAMLLLPMLGPDGGCNRALACLVADLSGAAAPRRFQLESWDWRAIPDAAPAQITPPPPVPVRQPDAAGFAENPQPWAPAPRTAPHLRLIKG